MISEHKQQPITITVIDSDHYRREGMLKQLTQLKAIIQIGYKSNTDQYIYMRENTKVERLDSSLITYRHFNDLDIQPNLHTTLTLLYGNNGPLDIRFDEPEDESDKQIISKIKMHSKQIERIQRRVDDDGNLTAAEAIEILEYSTRINQDIHNAQLPYCLDPKAAKIENTELLSVISILCQGYLAVHVNPTSGDLEDIEQKDNDIVSKAIDRMEWGKFLNDGGAEFIGKEMLDDEARCKLRAQVHAVDWWLILREGNLDINAAVDREWGDADPTGLEDIKDLMKRVCADCGTREGVSPREVANAYLAICDHPQFQSA